MSSSCKKKFEVKEQGIDPNLSMCVRVNSIGNAYVDQSSMSDVHAINPNPEKVDDYSGMVRIEAGQYTIGGRQRSDRPSQDYGSQPRSDEYPNATVKLHSFWIDATEVTNAQFAEFIESTGYVTTAERDMDINEIMAQLPPGSPAPDLEQLAPASLVFVQPKPNPSESFSVQDWWKIVKGASWRHPQGPDSDIIGKGNHPVVHVSWYDAMAYSRWAGKRLPTEAEWEYVSNLGAPESIFPWGNGLSEYHPKANFWQGDFPVRNSKQDGYYRLAPVMSFEPNQLGIYDMAGNVWEWCSDWYHSDYYKCLLENSVQDPKGPEMSYDPSMPSLSQKVVRGGSFLCHDSYCAGYRMSARMKSSPDTGLEHTGFRCVRDN